MRPIPSASTTVIRPRKGWVNLDWREMWDSRELLQFLVLRELTVRYRQTILGVAWAVLQPVLSMLLFSLIFGRLAKIPSDGYPYSLFVYSGLLPWMFVANAVTSASLSLVNQQALLTKIYLPRVFVPAAPVGAGLVDLCISMAVLALLMLYHGVAPGWGAVALPFLVLLTAAAAMGVGLTLAAISVTYRDFRYVVPFMIQLWMFASPVVYPVSLIPVEWQGLLSLNPMFGLIEAYRSALLGRPWNFPALAVSTLSIILVLTYGLFYFRKTERRFADVA
jgi:lipopolysaccharide transport system permease protein